MFASDAIVALDHYASQISKCVAHKNLKAGMILHSQVTKSAIVFNSFITNALIGMYAKCDDMESAKKSFEDLPFKNTHSWNSLINGYCKFGLFNEAHRVFEKMPERNLVSYNSLISSFSRHGFYEKSISMFKRMQTEYESLVIDTYSLVSIVGACACLGALDLLRQVHGVAAVIGLEFNVIASNALLDAYGKCHKPSTAFCIFSRMAEKDVVSLTSMVSAFTRVSQLDEASLLFKEMPIRNSVSWTALITGFAQNNHGYEALNFFKQMLQEGMQPSDSTYVSVLSACADLALLEKGKQIHGRIIRTSDKDGSANVFVVNTLIDMYCKCGNMKTARVLFDLIEDRDIVSWNSLVTGYAQNGQGGESLAVFAKMLEYATVDPNHVTFLGVLSACSHVGLVSEGVQILNLMKNKYGINPNSDHYAIVIDSLGRKNRLKEAMELIYNNPCGSENVGIWGALLGASRIYGNLDIARTAAEVLFEIEPANTARYVMLSNIYAAASKWDDVNKVREQIEAKGLKKEAAYSWIEIRNVRHEFVVKDKSHSEREDIYEAIGRLNLHMKQPWYLDIDGRLF